MFKVFEDLKNGTVRYTGCGLDYVILQNGFTLKTFGQTTAISITDVDALWDTIARTIVASKPTLEGQDVRFLRGKLDLTQDELAQAFGITRQAVIGWERKRNEAVPNSPARLLTSIRRTNQQRYFRRIIHRKPYKPQQRPNDAHRALRTPRHQLATSRTDSVEAATITKRPNL